MKVNEIQALIDEYYYWDLRVKSLECNYFADEIKLIYDDSEGNDVTYNFIGCYKSVFDHVKNYDKFKPVQEMVIGQIPYFLQDVEVSEIVEEEIHFFTCKINMFPLYLDIWCKDIKILREKNPENKVYIELKKDNT
jgi:hypothetical protein